MHSSIVFKGKAKSGTPATSSTIKYSFKISKFYTIFNSSCRTVGLSHPPILVWVTICKSQKTKNDGETKQTGIHTKHEREKQLRIPS